MQDEKGQDSGAGASASSRWSGRTRGGYFGNWFLIQIIRFPGLRFAYAWLVFIAAYFTLTDRRSFRCSADFLKRVLGPQPRWKWPGLVYRHFFSFGIMFLDRLAVLMDRGQLECRFEGEGQIRECLERGQGVILLGAHLGNWEVGGHLLSRLGRPVNLVVLEREEAAIRRLFEGALQARRFHLLTTDASPLRSVAIVAALRRGEIVALHGDRSFGGADCPAPFLGGTARFPVGPYLLAAVSGAPVFQVFVVRERLGHYRFFTFPAQYHPRSLLRSGLEGLRPCVETYAERLAAVARQYPLQWCNIYPYWEAAGVPGNSADSSRNSMVPGSNPAQPNAESTRRS